MARKRRAKLNVFVKPDEQWRACSAMAMARRRRAKLNVFVKPDEQRRACSAIAMARNRQQSQRRGHPHLIQQIAGTVTMRRPIVSNTCRIGRQNSTFSIKSSRNRGTKEEKKGLLFHDFRLSSYICTKYQGTKPLLSLQNKQ